MPISRIIVEAGTYDFDIDGTPGTVTVPVLTAGSINPDIPSRGDILSVLGSNGSNAATFQWQQDGADIGGATSFVYDTTPTGAGDYTVVVTDGVQTATSAAVIVPALTAGSIDQATPTVGDTLTVSGSNASQGATYQWQADGVDVQGATSASLDTGGLAVGDYTRITTDGGETATTAAVTVAAAPVGGIEPTRIDSVARAVGQSATFTINTSGYAAGDTLIMFGGGGNIPVTFTVAGSPVTVQHTTDIGSERRGALATYVLQPADISAGSVDVFIDNQGGGTVNYTSWHVDGAVSVVDPSSVNVNTTSTMSVTPTSAQNAVMIYMWGVDSRLGGAFTFTSGFDDVNSFEAFGSNGWMLRTNQELNASTGGFTTTWTEDPAATANAAAMIWSVE